VAVCFLRKGNGNRQAHVRISGFCKRVSVARQNYIYGDSVAIVDFHTPFTTIIIHKKEIAKRIGNQFELLWKLAKD